jgi:hypothetical protein
MRASLRRWVFAATVAVAGAALLGGAASQAVLTKPGPPLASTGNVNHVRGTSATLNGSVQPHGLATSYFFQYGTTVAYGSQTTPEALPAGFTPVPVAQTVTGLRLGEHYRIVATNADGTAFGHDRTYGAKSTRLRFVLASTQGTPPTTYAGTYVVSGDLTGPGNAFHRIALQASRFPYLEPFLDVGTPVSTGPTGAFTLRVPHMTISTQFRIRTLDPRPVLSAVVTAKVSYRVSLKVRTSGRGGIVRLYGTVTPAVVGARIAFQVQKAIRPNHSERESAFATQFTTKTKRGTRTMSRFSLITAVRRGGYYRAYVEIVRGPLVSGGSSTVHLTATSRKPRKKR